MSITWGPADRSALTPIEGGVTAPGGFRAGAVAAGIKPSGRPDLALVVADGAASCAVVTTTNLVKAAPCVLTERHAADGHARAVIVNAGNANACTGDEGESHAQRTAEAVAEAIGAAADQVLVMSTGVIGVPLPIDRLLSAVPSVVADAEPDTAGADRAATAILTTDTRTKQVAYRVEDGTGTCTVAGMAKGSGMIEPNMATMLAVLTTDAPVAGPVLRQLLRQAAARTFNRISVDACGSTNDTVALLASGQAGTPPGIPAIQTAIEAVCADLAEAIVRDGEGVTRIARLRVRGARDESQAAGLARAVAASDLVRTALHGADPNWGRILGAMGASGIDFEPSRVNVTCGGITVCRFGAAAVYDRGQAAAAMNRPDVDLDIDLGLGRAESIYLTADLSRDYITINADYTT